ncbi:hypothetical protein WKK05_38975 (plasmid) [Nostoc sp. UHCC 0302]|uniref:hypothetical protein n=1 Tax=Nostoc sp. UHCC 0302 TaxID=3134896 RepID=UPI00311CB1E5
MNTEQINDYLALQTQPSVVLMNPPFSSSPRLRDQLRWVFRHRNPGAIPRQ